MREQGHHEGEISSEILEVIRAVAAALRAVKLYPPNNPVYAQSVRRAFESLERRLARAAEFRLEVQKTAFAWERGTVDDDSHIHRGIASDLFTRGIREIIFRRGISEPELQAFYNMLSTPPEGSGNQDSVEALIWERGLSHVAVTTARLGAVVCDDPNSGPSAVQATGAPSCHDKDTALFGEKLVNVFGGTVMLSDIVADPRRFGALMVSTVQKDGGSQPEQANRILESYRATGLQVLEVLRENPVPVFDAMADSLLSMEPSYRDSVIAGKLYADFDRRTIAALQQAPEETVPRGLHEVLSSRFSRSWTTSQVSALLRKSSEAAVPRPPAGEKCAVLSRDLYDLATEVAAYTPEEVESLKVFGDFGAEKDILDATARTLIHLLRILPETASPASADKTLKQFSLVVHQLEEVLACVLDRKDHVLAAEVLRSFRAPVPPVFRPRLAEAIKRAGDKKTIARLLDGVPLSVADSPAYQAVRTCLSLLDREATPALLELLAEEEDRTVRVLVVKLLKDLGKNQLATLGERLSDERWYFVRNIVNILGESKKEEAAVYLETVADNRNFQIRQEVVRALVSLGGERATGLLIRFMKDEDIDIRFMAIRGLGSLAKHREKAEQALIAFLGGGWFRRIDEDLCAEALSSLGRIGGQAALQVLGKYTRRRWWKPRKAEETVCAAARKAIQEIERRLGHAET